MNNHNFKMHVGKFERIHNAKVIIAKESSDNPSITINEKEAWYICYVYSQFASDIKIKRKAIQAMNQYRAGTKSRAIEFTSKIGSVHGVDLVCDWVSK